MATHPVVDNSAKDEIRVRTINTLAAKTLVLKDTQWFPESAPVRHIRTIAMVCAAYAANVLENALEKMGNDARERAFNRVDELLAGFSTFPFAVPPSGSSGIGQNLASLINEELEENRNKELQFEVIAAVLQVYTRLDSIL
jgi:Golgi phosphoprotein 3